MKKPKEKEKKKKKKEQKTENEIMPTPILIREAQMRGAEADCLPACST